MVVVVVVVVGGLRTSQVRRRGSRKGLWIGLRWGVGRCGWRGVGVGGGFGELAGGVGL